MFYCCNELCSLLAEALSFVIPNKESQKREALLAGNEICEKNGKFTKQRTITAVDKNLWWGPNQKSTEKNPNIFILVSSERRIIKSFDVANNLYPTLSSPQCFFLGAIFPLPTRSISLLPFSCNSSCFVLYCFFVWEVFCLQIQTFH